MSDEGSSPRNRSDASPPERPSPPPQAGIRRQNHLAVAAQFAAALVGVYVMAAPAIWDYGRPAEAVERFIGPLIATFATVAAAEVLRKVRYANIILAAALAVLAISPWPWAYPVRAIISDVVAAVVVVALSLVPYPPLGRYGGGWKHLFRKRPTG